MGADVQPEYVDVARSAPLEHFTPMLKLDLVCQEGKVEQYMNIVRYGRTRQRSDGIVFVSAVEDAVRIRSGERGDWAL